MPLVYFSSFFLLAAGSCPDSEPSTLLQHQAPQFARRSEEIYDAFIAVERTRARDDESGSAAPGSAPCMTKEEIDLYYEKLSTADVYFEFGVGGSTTLAAARKNIRCMKGIDSSMEWIDIVSKQPSVSTAIAEGRLELVHVDIGKTGAWGYPAEGADPAKLKNYSQQTFGHCGRQAQRRLVLVDGRYRVACFLKMLASLEAMNPEEALATQIMIHDYERPYYHTVEDFADLVERRDRLAVFRMKPEATFSALKEAAAKYELDPK